MDAVRDENRRESRYVMDRMLSIDPITKDVQRRMSIKDHHHHHHQRRLSQDYASKPTSSPAVSQQVCYHLLWAVN